MISDHVKSPVNPSRKAIARVENPLPIPTCCPYCQAPVVIKGHAEIYNGRAYGEWPWVYGCSACDARVGMHPFTNLPLGTLANEQLRKAREQHKKPFEAIWREKHLSRKDAYRWLAEQLGITTAECHFGLFDQERCALAGTVCQSHLVVLRTKAQALAPEHLLPDHLAPKDSAGRWRSRGVVR